VPSWLCGGSTMLSSLEAFEAGLSFAEKLNSMDVFVELDTHGLIITLSPFYFNSKFSPPKH
jgi:hypothetical protein